MADRTDARPDPPTGPAGQASSRLTAAAGAALLTVVLWNVDVLAPVLFPLRLLVTFAHEAAHGLTATLTGGDFLGFEVAGNGSGLATTRGGWRWLILPAGYLGAAATGATLLVGSHAARRPQRVALGFAVWAAGVALVFGWGSVLAVGGGLGLAAGFLALSRVARDLVVVVVLDLAGLVVGWSSVLDLTYLLRQPGSSNGVVANDAAAFGAHVGIGGTRLWAAVWLLVALALLATAGFRVLRSSDPTPAATV